MRRSLYLLINFTIIRTRLVLVVVVVVVMVATMNIATASVELCEGCLLSHLPLDEVGMGLQPVETA